MTKNEIKTMIESLRNKKVLVKVDVGRNKFEYLEGTIINTYPYLFTMLVGNEIKSFTYADVLIKNVVIKVK